nr:MAG TPA: hypothetical protein [Inoviridae sp.]
MTEFLTLCASFIAGLFNLQVPGLGLSFLQRR